MAEDATCCNCWIVSFHFAFFVCLLWFVFSFFWHSLFTNWQLPWLAMALNNSMTRPIAWQFICFDCIVHHEYQCVLNSYSYRIWQMPWKIINDISIKKKSFRHLFRMIKRHGRIRTARKKNGHRWEYMLLVMFIDSIGSYFSAPVDKFLRNEKSNRPWLGSVNWNRNCVMLVVVRRRYTFCWLGTHESWGARTDYDVHQLNISFY